MDKRPCAVCKKYYANPHRDMCQLCFQSWAASGRNSCARCRAPKEINQFDLCGNCYEIWKIETEEYDIKSVISAISSITEENAAQSGEYGPSILRKKREYVPTPKFPTLCDEYTDLCGVFNVGLGIAAGRPIRDPSIDSGAGVTLWYKVDPEAMGDNECPLCLGPLRGTKDFPVKLAGCTHYFHFECAKQLCNNGTSIKCPVCSVVTGIVTGNQPPGLMSIMVDPGCSVAGAPPGEGIIFVTYIVPPGTQGPEHKAPGTPFRGSSRTSVFPNTAEGRKAVRMVRLAFKRRLVFTIGRSATSGDDNVVVWAGVLHKTRLDGGAENFGYPDPGYLGKVSAELTALGIPNE